MYGAKSMSDDARNLTDDSAREAGLGEAAKRDAISRVLGSELFSSTPRLHQFLAYVGNEAILGNEDRLRAKSIAHFVYQRDPVEERSSANVVRVEARRLRRLLEDYYESEGKSDPVRIHIDKGGYAPRFEKRAPAGVTPDPEDRDLQETSPGAEADTARRPPWTWMAAMGLLVMAALGLATLQGDRRAPTGSIDMDRLGREALMEQSPAAVEAANLTAQARGLIYPVFDAERQRLTTELFRAAIEKDPNSVGAHAGAAQTLASLALLSISGPRHDALLEDARLMLARALELAPSDAWSQSAAGWVAFVDGDFESAMRHSERAVALAPNDGNVLDFYGVIAVMSGEWDKAIFAATQDRQRIGGNTRYADQNILAAARFHMGNYREAAKIIEANNAQGGPLSAPVVVYLAATYQALGREREGQRLVSLLEEDWPAFSADVVLKRLHRDTANAMEVLSRLRLLGWDG